jgi:translation elongation factor EF-1beta
MSETTTIEDRLQGLGDPSGRQDSQFWNEWFEIVCRDKHQPFEWYCDTEEVMRVLSYHISGDTCGRTIHPGSGTSMLPVKLREVYPDSCQVVVDISEVAIEEMKEHHVGSVDTDRIEYLQADILNDKLPYEGSEFCAWIDKGFLDAVFCKDNTKAGEQSRFMFHESLRLLEKGNGVMVIISLAEDHSLELILDAYLEQDNDWDSELHVWEVKPTSGTMRPFAFVLKRASKSAVGSSTELSLVWHEECKDAVTVQCESADELRSVLAEHVELSRKRFMKSAASDDRKLLVTLEIKPYEAEADLVKLATILMEMEWRVEGGDELLSKPEWQTFDETGLMYDVVPIGYGICKLRMRCIYPSDDVDALVSAIGEWEGSTDFEDGIQSVDVDWTNTYAIASHLPTFTSLLPSL